MTVKELLINELNQMSETELQKALRLFQAFGLTSHKKYPLENWWQERKDIV
jgi:hypothetical protein